MTFTRQEMLNMLEKWYKSWNDHDLENVMKLFHDDIVFENWDGTKIKGKKSLRRAWMEWFENHGGFQFFEEDTFIDEVLRKVLFQWRLEWPSTQAWCKGDKEIRYGVDVLHFREGKIITKTTFSKTFVEINDTKRKLTVPDEH